MVAVAGILDEHLAVALDGVDRRAQVVAQLGAIAVDVLDVGAALRQHLFEQRLQRKPRRVDAFEIGA